MSIETRIMVAVEKSLVDDIMLETGDRVLVGLSGGGDSMALIDILARLSIKMQFEIGAAHLNHGLREGADAEEKLVREWVTRRKIPFYSEKRSVGINAQKDHLSVEEAAREVRYHYLQEVARHQGYTHIAIGHHLDDNAESVLMFLLRGSGPDGLRGIPAVRLSDQGSATIIRPLLNTDRSDIKAYLYFRQLPCIVDESNRNPKFTRNRIRHQLMPLLKRDYNPRISTALNRLSSILRAERSWINRITKPQLMYLSRSLSNGGLEIEVYSLNRKPIGMRRNMIRQAISDVKGDLRRIGYDHVKDVMGLLKDSPKPSAVDLPGGIRCRRVGAILQIFQFRHRRTNHKKTSRSLSIQQSSEFDNCFLVAAPRRGHEIRVLIPEIGRKLVFTYQPASHHPPAGYRAGQSVALFDMDKIQFPLRIRNVRPGDRFQLQKGERWRKINDILSDQKINRASRPYISLLISGEDIIWIIGLQTGLIGRSGPTTQTLLRVESLLVS